MAFIYQHIPEDMSHSAANPFEFWTFKMLYSKATPYFRQF